MCFVRISNKQLLLPHKLLANWFCIMEDHSIQSAVRPESLCKTDAINLSTPNDPYIGHTAPLPPSVTFYIFIKKNIGTECFKHALSYPSFSSKCSMFFNANLFGSCIIHILLTGCADIKKFRRQNVNLIGLIVIIFELMFL